MTSLTDPQIVLERHDTSDERYTSSRPINKAYWPMLLKAEYEKHNLVGDSCRF